jgi:hypothetical protein
MSKVRVDQIFGVSKDMILSYLEREKVDGRFKLALESDKHVVVYGASKQGKSALLLKHLRVEDSIGVGCTPKTDTKSIYSSLLRQIGVKIETTSVEKSGTTGSVAVKTSFKAKIPFFGEGQAGVDAQAGGTTGNDVTYKTVEFNLELAQDISEILETSGFNKLIILNNFHYLNEEVQTALAFDLRLFQEKGFRFIILGVWREKNRLNQFNGDLVDRIIDIPVEPWIEEEFQDIIAKGCRELNISFSCEIISRILTISFGSIGIVQELCKELCYASGFEEKNFADHIEIHDVTYLDVAVSVKVEEYSSRHLRALESISTAGIQKDGLYMPYYVVRALVTMNVNDLINGIARNDLHEAIRSIHYRPDSVRSGDMTYVLHGLGEIQIKKRFFLHYMTMIE